MAKVMGCSLIGLDEIEAPTASQLSPLPSWCVCAYEARGHLGEVHMADGGGSEPTAC